MNKRAFSIAEFLIVVGIVAIWAAVAILAAVAIHVHGSNSQSVSPIIPAIPAVPDYHRVRNLSYGETIIEGCEYLVFSGIHENVPTHKGNCTNACHRFMSPNYNRNALEDNRMPATPQFH